MYLLGTDANGVEYSNSTKTSTSAARVGVPDYVCGTNVKFCLVVGTGAKSVEYSGSTETGTPVARRGVLECLSRFSLIFPLPILV